MFRNRTYLYAEIPAGRTLPIPDRIYVPNLGLVKHKNGAKIAPNP